MLARVMSAVVTGIEAAPISVEVDVAHGLPSFTTVGLPDVAVKESRDRVRAAIKNSGFTFPVERITVNLAPADLRKEGSSFDLPIALGLLAATGVVSPESLAGTLILGELSLDGGVRPIKGALPMALMASRQGCRRLLLPAANTAEAALVDGLEIYPLEHLGQAVTFLTGERPLKPVTGDPQALFLPPAYEVDFAEVRGQEAAKRGLEIVAAGGHNLAMVGPPGTGKTMLSRRLPTILPSMGLEEAIEVTAIHSVAGLLGPQRGLLTERPFRAPHHTISDAGLIGGGNPPRPGEISLAHRGVLFMDEFPEFPQHALEALRQPLEDGEVTISRAAGSVSFPARFILVAALNPCRRGCPSFEECLCTPAERQRYLAKLSRPLLDRIDLHLEVPAVRYREMAGGSAGEPSAVIRQRVERAWQVQQARFAGARGRWNAHMGPRLIRRYCPVPPEAQRMLELAMDRLGLSGRAHDRILKVARTIADLAGADGLATEHVAEALQYRALDRWQGR